MADKTEEVVWKTYPGIDFLQVNQFGEVRTVDHYATRKDGRKQFVKGRILKQQRSKGGYMYVSTHVNGKPVYLLIHRIVATCFIPNPNNYPEVNHKDNNRTNNNVDNLEFCTRQYNQDYRKNFGTSAAEMFGRPTIAVNPKTSEVFYFESQHEAARQLGFNSSSINNAIKGRRKTIRGHWFCYADSEAVEKTRIKFGDKVADEVEKLINQL